jgi:hypothetical protein
MSTDNDRCKRLTGTLQNNLFTRAPRGHIDTIIAIEASTPMPSGTLLEVGMETTNAIENRVREQMKAIYSAESLVDLDDVLTQSMARQQIQALLKDDGLEKILSKVAELTQTEKDEEDVSLLVLALLGRLAAVARGRESEIFKLLPSLINEYDLGSLESPLLDGDGKTYAVQSLLQLDNPSLASYALRESIGLDTAEKARKLLFELLLKHYKNVTDAWEAHSYALNDLSSISNSDSRLRRARRISAGWLEVMRASSIELGERPGEALTQWVTSLLTGDKKDIDESVLFSIVDDAIDLLLRLIEIRFSYAMLTETYMVIGQVRQLLGRARWITFLEQSRSRNAVNLCLREAALVLARQGKTDKALMEVMQSLYQSKTQLNADLKRHFGEAQELDPEVRQWWGNGGIISGGNRPIVHKFGNSEDQLIGSLLIEVLSTQTAMEALSRSVAPLLEISDPIAAATVNAAAGGYADIARVAQLLARMRRLTKTDLKGEVVEYNPLQHELLSDNRHGVRRVKVVKDGIQKDFGGSIKTLVKPWVEPLD